MVKHTGLGQGVGLLFGGTEEEDRYFQCKVENILPNRFQPRSHFDDGLLAELAESIRANGVIQPLIVKNAGIDGNYELVAGERRLRAAKLAGLATVPVVVMTVEQDDQLLELALIENVQRTDLNAIEEAEAYQKLIDSFGYTQEQTAQRVGKSRTTVTNMLRLLHLPELLKQDVISGTLSEGHARTLLRLIGTPETLKKVRDEIILPQLSVRQAEKLVKKESLATPPPDTGKRTAAPALPIGYLQSLTNQLSNRLGTRVHIQQQQGRGRVEIEYYSPDDLQRLTTLLLQE